MRTNILPAVVKNLLILNGLLFLLTLVFRKTAGYELTIDLGLYYFDSPFFKPHQIISHMFMHGNVMHLAFNMFALWMFGSPLENTWGSKRFLMYYLVTGLGAAALHSGVNAMEVYNMTGSITHEAPELLSQAAQRLYVIPTVGASGAVFGLLLAFGMLFPNTELMLIFLPIPIKAKYFVFAYGIMELFLGMQRIEGDNIAHFAHLGGMLFGFILIRYWNRNRSRFY